MPKGPRYNRNKAFHVTEEMLSWGAKKAPKKPDYVAPPPPPVRKVQWRCAFCGAEERDHECAEFQRLLKKQRSSDHTIRPGVPWDWCIGHYFLQLHTLPRLPYDSYDGYKPGAELPYLEWLQDGAHDEAFPIEGIGESYLAFFRDGKIERGGAEDDEEEAG